MWRAALATTILTAALIAGTAVPGGASSVDTLRAPAPVLRLRTPFPNGVRIRSIRDNRARVVHYPIFVIPADTLRGVDTLRVVTPPDLDGIESRLLAYMDRRFAELEMRQRESLAGLGRPVPEPITALLPTPAPTPVIVAAPETPAARPGKTIVERTAGGLGGATIGAALSGNDSVASDTTSASPLPAAPSGETATGLGFAADSLRYRVPSPTVSVVEVERAVLDTGLLRTVNIVFEFNQASLMSASLPVLDAMGNVLTRYPEVRLMIGGHTDSVGTAERNLVLSQARADSVLSYLVRAHSVEKARLVARGFGETQPIASNETATGRTLNRRVEFVVLKADSTR